MFSINFVNYSQMKNERLFRISHSAFNRAFKRIKNRFEWEPNLGHFTSLHKLFVKKSVDASLTR